jgi:hypothetical protein
MKDLPMNNVNTYECPCTSCTFRRENGTAKTAEEKLHPTDLGFGPAGEFNFQPLADLKDRERICWDMASVFLRNKDAHGLMDVGAELQSLALALREVHKALA